MKHLLAIGSWARNILAIIGLITVIIKAGLWTYEKLSLDDTVAIIRPICESYVFDVPDRSSSYSSNQWKSLGVNIFAKDQVVRPRIRISGVFTVSEWGMHSDGLSEQEMDSYLKLLPVGDLQSEFLTPPLPSLPPNTHTTVEMLGIPVSESHCFDPYWADVIPEEGAALHVDPSVTQLRELPRIIVGPFGVLTILCISTFLVLSVFLYWYIKSGRGRVGT